MILYVDTSCLLKRYVDEPHRESVLRWLDAADAIATSRVTYPETAAALAARHRRGHLTPARVRWALDHLAARWHIYLVVDLAEVPAARLAVKHVLRGFDAVQLAAATTLATAVGSDAIAFASFDTSLKRAAAAEGLIVLEPSDES